MTSPDGASPDGSLAVGMFRERQLMTEEQAKGQATRGAIGSWENAQGSHRVFSYGIDREVVRLDNRIDDIVLGGQQAQLMTCSASTTWVKPPGARKVVVDVMAGSSGGGRNTMGSGAGGGYGGYSGGWYSYEFQAADLPASVPVIVGRGGAGATSNGHGAPGEDSKFGDFILAGGAGPTTYGTGNKSFRTRGGNGWNGGEPNQGTAGSSGSYSQGGAGGARGENGQTGESVAATRIGMGSSGGGGGGGGLGVSPGRGGHGGWPSGAGGGGGGWNYGDSGNGGNAAGGAVYITTYIVDDISEAPTVPTNLVANNITETSATLTWTAATDDVAVTEYEVYVNGLLWGSTTTITFELTGLVKATNYQVEVKAVDEHGFRSDPATIPVLTAGGTPLPPQLIGSSTGGYVQPGFYTTYDIPIPTHQALDLLVAIVGTSDNLTPSTPMGWTRQLIAAGPESPQQLTVFTKIATPNEAPVVSFSTSVAQMWFASIHSIRYATGVDVAAGRGDSTAGTIEMPVVTTTGPNRIILHAAATAASSFRSKTWSGATELTDHGFGLDSEFGVSMSTAYRFQAEAGPTTAVTATNSTSGGTAAAATIALK